MLGISRNILRSLLKRHGFIGSAQDKPNDLPELLAGDASTFGALL